MGRRKESKVSREVSAILTLVLELSSKLEQDLKAVRGYGQLTLSRYQVNKGG